MAIGLNQVNIIGYTGSDPVIKTNSNSTTIATFQIATSESYKPRDSNETINVTEWHRIVAFGKIAEVIKFYLKKGMLVTITGKLRTRKWKDDKDVERSVTEIILAKNSNFQILERKPVDFDEKNFQFDSLDMALAVFNKEHGDKWEDFEE